MNEDTFFRRGWFWSFDVVVLKAWVAPVFRKVGSVNTCSFVFTGQNK